MYQGSTLLYEQLNFDGIPGFSVPDVILARGNLSFVPPTTTGQDTRFIFAGANDTAVPHLRVLMEPVDSEGLCYVMVQALISQYIALWCVHRVPR